MNMTMMKAPGNKLLRALMDVKDSPCISLYMPTHRNHPDNAQDPIRYKNLLKELEASLLKKYSADETQRFLSPFYGLNDDTAIWNHTAEGLAVFSSAEMFEVVTLQIPAEELVVVAETLHTKPIRKYLQSVDRYQVVGISLHDMQLFEGNRHSIVEIELPEDFPNTIEKALGSELTDKHLTVASYGGVGGESGNMYHGQGSKKDEVDTDAERFFRIAGDAVLEQYSKPSGLPLILAALPEHHNLFQKVSKNQNLLPVGIPVNPKSVPAEKFISMAWEVMEPAYLDKLNGLAENYRTAKANDKGNEKLREVARAAAEGRVDTLLVEANRVIGGKIMNQQTGAIKTDNIENPEVDDLLDDIGELVVKMGGNVMVLPAENMPETTGLAAILRY